MKRFITRIIASALPKRAGRIHKDPGTANAGWLDRMVKAGLYHRAVAQNDLEHLAWYHRQFWNSEAARNFFGDESENDDQPLLIKEFGLHDRIAELLQSQPARHIIEIGSGNGRTLDHLCKRFPNLDKYIGLDLNATQNHRNREQFADSQIQFITTNAADWIADHARPRSLFVTSGGVLEYFAQSAVAILLENIAKQHAPSVFAIIEPVDDRHDLNSQHDSFVYGDDRSFSHNYPWLFQQAGFDVQYRAEQRALGHRWTVLLATTPNSSEVSRQ